VVLAPARKLAAELARLVVVLALGCSETPAEETCLEQVDTECTPLFEPTYTELYTRRLSSTCSSSGASCHGPNGRMGGLSFADPDESYDLLLGKTGSKARVVPFDPRCSELVQRLDGEGAILMPPGEPLSEGERCAVRLWIANGALND
jgi:hypothetical protein